MTNPTFWRGKRVLLTGHTGFKGAWMALWLHRLGAQVTGISLSPATTHNLFNLVNIQSITDSHFCDIRDAGELAGLIKKTQPEIVFHLAAQALVHASYRDPLTTFATNVQGTANVLDALRAIDCVRAVVAITTDKVYKNLEQAYPYRETDALGGHDPYSASKAAAEIVIASYRDAYLKDRGIAVASARAGNVIGGGDWSADRLIPDAMRAWNAQQALQIRRPQAIRPWQHVLEPLAGYLQLAEQLWRQPAVAGAYNFGPQTHEAATVREVVELAQSAYGMGQVTWGDGTDGPHEAGWLALEVAKSRTVLGVKPRWALAQSVQRTVHWYRQLHSGADALGLCQADISAYESASDSSPAP
ncbi:MAG: CDP-glucose 4,6-dehydratase [Sideroxydans sp.]|nr:CDP-glucose 4,6-dehydratase [Sideroxydans sp.]